MKSILLKKFFIYIEEKQEHNHIQLKFNL